MPRQAEPNQWCVIVNPRAGNGAGAKAWPALKALLDRHLSSYTARFTEAPQHAIGLAEEAVADGYRRLLAVGGDGTNHEVINGIIRQQSCSSTDICYGLIPIGTGNDWRRTYRIPKNTGNWVRQIPLRRTVLQDLGKLTYRNDQQELVRYFTNVAGMAYDGFIARHVNQHPIGNKLGYLFAIVKCLMKYDIQKAHIEFDDHTIEQYCYTINVGICPFSGGGMRLVPHAVPDDGRLALTIAGPVSRLGVLVNTPRFFNGHIDQHPKVDLYQVKQVKVTSLDDRPIPVEADGEFLGHTPVVFEILPQALRVIVPEHYQPRKISGL